MEDLTVVFQHSHGSEPVFMVIRIIGKDGEDPSHMPWVQKAFPAYVIDMGTAGELFLLNALIKIYSAARTLFDFFGGKHNCPPYHCIALWTSNSNVQQYISSSKQGDGTV